MNSLVRFPRFGWLVVIAWGIGSAASPAASPDAGQNIRKLAMEMPRIDTHAHLGSEISQGVLALPNDLPISDVAHFRTLAEGAKVL